jgi:hypothetical protein
MLSAQGVNAHEIHQRMQAARRLLVTALALSSVLFWVGALWPAQRTQLYALAIPFWVLIVPATITFAIRESIWRRRCGEKRWTS